MAGAFLDIHFLSDADFLVCTFSSNICRLAYELMQYKYPDRDISSRVRSLDTEFYFLSDIQNYKKAIMNNSINGSTPYDSKNQLEFIKGDIIYTDIYNGLKYEGYKLNGYIYGKNLRTEQSGHFPSYKVLPFFKEKLGLSYLLYN